MIDNVFERALNLENPWYIKELKFNEEEKRLDIYIDFKKGSTFSNELEGIITEHKAYDTVNKTWRHLNFFEHECYLHARVPRIKIGDKKIKLIKTPWEGLSNGFTLLFEALMLQLCSAMPVHRVEKIINVSDDKIWRILDKYVEEALKTNDYSLVNAIGIDETSKTKGHNYITLFVDLQERKTIFITEGKDNQTVKRFTEDFEEHNGNVDSIKDVSCDMSKAFIKGVTENLPEAKITFDKFHIMKIINSAVDEVRREESKELKILAGTRYIFLKNECNLTKKQAEKLEEVTMSNLNLKTLRAYHIRQAFQDIYNSETKEEFLIKLKKWYFWATHSRLEPIKKAAKTIKEHWDGVVRWKTSLINNGILEGLNSVIQAAKSKARGYTTFKNFKIVAYLLTGKLNFNLINKAYQPL